MGSTKSFRNEESEGNPTLFFPFRRIIIIPSSQAKKADSSKAGGEAAGGTGKNNKNRARQNRRRNRRLQKEEGLVANKDQNNNKNSKGNNNHSRRHQGGKKQSKVTAKMANQKKNEERSSSNENDAITHDIPTTLSSLKKETEKEFPQDIKEWFSTLSVEDRAGALGFEDKTILSLFSKAVTAVQQQPLSEGRPLSSATESASGTTDRPKYGEYLFIVSVA